MQFDFGNLESPLSGTVFINGNLEPWRDALHSSHKGGTRPSYAVEGMMWVNDTTNPWILNMFDGSNDIAIGTFNTTTNVFTPSGVSQAAEDISFDNTDSGLAATNVQDAIDEAVSDFSDFEGRVDGFATAAQGAKADTALQEQARIVKTSTSGTGITFSGSDIPTGTKKITINFMGVSTSGSNYLSLQIGTGNAIETSGYFGSANGGLAGNQVSGTNSNNGSSFPLFGATATLATNIYEGSICIVLSDPSTNKWCLSGSLCESDRACGFSIGGSKSILGVLDIIRITTSTGIDTFDAGSIGIICEK